MELSLSWPSWARLTAAWTNWWRRYRRTEIAVELPPPVQNIDPIVPEAPAAPCPPTAQVQNRAADVEDAGRWYFKRDILDRLHVYFRCVQRMRSGDPEAYALYSRIGAVVINPAGVYDRKDTLPRDPTRRLAFGAVACPFVGADTKERMYPIFCYFQRFATPPVGVQRGVPGDVYQVVMYYIDRLKPHGVAAPFSFHVAVDTDGTLRMLKERVRYHQPLRCSHAAASRLQFHGGSKSIPHQGWSWPTVVTHPDPEWHNAKWTNEQRAADMVRLFSMFYNWYELASMDVRVAVSKGGTTAAFSVDLLRMPNFFADREVGALAADGRRKRIFHIVRTHARTRANGKTSSVRSHFRGLRIFDWHGYRVRITMPGKHHSDLLAATFGAYDRRAKDRPKGLIKMREMARKMGAHLEA